MTLQIEAGKFYRTRDGHKVGPMGIWCRDYFDAPTEAFDGDYWCADGTNGEKCSGQDPQLDLVAEWTDEPPIAQAGHDYTKDWLARWGAEGRSSPVHAPQSSATGAEVAFDNLAVTTFGPLCDYSVSDGHNPVNVPVNGMDTTGKRYNCDSYPVQPDVKMLRATEIASKAADLVGGDRDRQHGAKRDNFGRIAEMWNAWLRIRREPAAPLDAHDVGVMMTFMKMARTQSGNLNLDDYVDAAGYASCAGEVAQAA